MDMAKNDTIFSFEEIVNAKVRARRLVPNNGKFLFIDLFLERYRT